MFKVKHAKQATNQYKHIRQKAPKKSGAYLAPMACNILSEKKKGRLETGNAFNKTREDYGDKLAYCACEQKHVGQAQRFESRIMRGWASAGTIERRMPAAYNV